MRTALIVIVSLCALSVPLNCMAESELDISTLPELTHERSWQNAVTPNLEYWWKFIQGSPTDHQLFVGMFSFHFTPSSLGTRQWKNKLTGMQYSDFIVFAFENSFYNWCTGVAYTRNLYQASLSNEWDMNVGYRAGLVYGYEEGEAPFSDDFSFVPLVALYSQFIRNEHYGVEVMLTSSISVGFFYQF